MEGWDLYKRKRTRGMGYDSTYARKSLPKQNAL